MDALKVSVRDRLLLIDPARPLSLRPLAKRWTGQLPEDGVLTAHGSLQSGACGHFSLFRWQMRRHVHPGDRPVPADLRAALEGTAPVPEWFMDGAS